MNLWQPCAAACAALLLAGCSIAVSGRAVTISPLPEPPSRPVAELLPKETELSAALGSSMRSRYGGRPGGVEVLPNGKKGAAPLECLAVQFPAMRYTYSSAPVRAAIQLTWATNTDVNHFPTPSFRTTSGIIELDTRASARTWYSQFSTQWRQCQGRTVTLQRSANYILTFEIISVSDSGNRITSIGLLSGPNGLRPDVVQRVLAQEGRYLIDTETIDTTEDPAKTPPTTHDAETITDLIAHKINTPK
ncbi:MAG: sensor domain-containing protein [Mycobacterium sp.]